MGFLTLASADVLYKASGLWSKTCETLLLWSDQPSNIGAWLLGRNLSGVETLLASKDASAAAVGGVPRCIAVKVESITGKDAPAWVRP